jgi:hypothetical protein
MHRYILSFCLLLTGAPLASSWSAEHGDCELCIYSVHQVQYGSLPSCGGTTKVFSYSACSQVVQSMLAYAHDVMHLISYGCYQYDPYRGWQTVKPCPAHVVCGRLPNIYDESHQTMCPTDFHYRFPHALSALAPKQYNPLLPYAVEQYRNDKSSSIMQEEGAPSAEPGGTRPSLNGPNTMRFRQREIELRGSSADQTTYPATAFPDPKDASGLPAAIYAEKTNPMLSSATPGALATRQMTLPTGQQSFGLSTRSRVNENGDALLEQKAQRLNAVSSNGAVPASTVYHPAARKSLLSGVQLPFAPPAGAMRGV